MTVEAIARKAGPYDYTSGAAYPFAYKVFAKTDVYVVVTENDIESIITLDTDYTVTLNDDQDNNPGGYVSLLTQYGSNCKVAIGSDVPYDQGMTLTNKGGFYPDTLNKAYDKLTILCQQLLEQVSRCIKVNISSSLSAEDYKGQLDGTTRDAAESAAVAASSAQDAASSAATAVTLANKASMDASSAVATAGQAETAAASATATANKALSKAETAITTADTATTRAGSALEKAQSAENKASSAETTAGKAETVSGTALNTATAAKSTAQVASDTASTALATANEAKETSENALQSIPKTVSQNVETQIAQLDIPSMVTEQVDAGLDEMNIDGKIASKVQEAISGVTIPGLSTETITGALGYTPYDAETNAKDFATSAEVGQAIQQAVDAIPEQVNADWNATEGKAQILNKPALKTVATSGSYQDLTDKPAKVSAFENDVGYIDQTQLASGLASKQDVLTYDTVPTAGSTNPVTSEGIKSAIDAKDSLPAQTGHTGKYLTTDGATASWADTGIDGKASKMEKTTIGDATPSLAVTSGKAYVCSTAITSLTLTALPGADSYEESSIWFVAGDTAPTITIPSGVDYKTIGDLAPEANKAYVLSIMANTLILAEVEAGA